MCLKDVTVFVWKTAKNCFFGGFRAFCRNFRLFQSCLEAVLNQFGHCFGLKKPTFGPIFNSKGPKMTTTFEILGLKFCHIDRFEGSVLAIFGVKKVVFWTFSKLF